MRLLQALTNSLKLQGGLKTLGPRLGEGRGGVLPIMAYTGRHRPKGVPFSNFRNMNGCGFRLSQSRSHGFLVWCGRTRLSLARSRFALGARTIALRAHCRATRSKARLVSKSSADSTSWSIWKGRKIWVFFPYIKWPNRPAEEFIYTVKKSIKCSGFVISSYLKDSAFTAIERNAKF